MRTTKLLKMGLFLGIGGLACGPAIADSCTGRFTNVGQSAETIDLGKGHTLTIFVARGSVTSENSSQNGVGGCGGYVLTTPDGKTRLAYACARKNKDGDSWSDAGGIEPGADRGTWTQTGGTGVFARKNSSGWWQVAMDDGKVTSGIWGGNCK
jgi:hypothetical protein